MAGHAFPIAFRRTIGFGFLDHGNQDLKLIEIVASRGRVVGVLPAPRLHDTEFVVGGQMDRQGALRLSIGRPSGGSRAATWQPLARKWKTAAEAPPPSHGAHLRLPASDGDSVQAAQANLDRGLLVGCDPAGTCFYDRQRSWSVRTLDAYDGDRPLASVELPERPVWKALAGADLWLSREGEVYEIYVGPRSMHVVSWVLER